MKRIKGRGVYILFQKNTFNAQFHPPDGFDIRGCGSLPEFPQGSTLLTLLPVSPQGSGGGAIVGGAPPPQGSELVGDVGDATPHGSVGAVPHGPEDEGPETVSGGEGPAELTVAAAGAPQGSTALSSIKAPLTKKTQVNVHQATGWFCWKKEIQTQTSENMHF